jgi:phage terminase large subunit-like protein
MQEIRAAAEADLETFIRLVAKYQVLGSVHQELLSWMTRPSASSHQLILLPRDHGKSRMVAFWVAWMITRQPDIRILYISSTSNLAEKQLHFIKQILTSPIYRRYWPEMINAEEGKREKWSAGEISVDHPKRKEEAIRDPTVFTAGLTTSITGMHCDVAVLDDVVVYENAYTEEGRRKVESQYSLLTSIQGTGSIQKVVGTRYHPKDLYGTMIEMEAEDYDEDGNIIGSTPVYEVFERAVENAGDGTGEFLWPKQQRTDGKWFGFDRAELAKKRATYPDKTQFRAQYYNDPNDPDNARIDRDRFQYYEPRFLKYDQGNWFYKDRKLNIFAAVDFAYTVHKRSDFTAIVVIGVDREWNTYVLEIDRFKTDKISEYFRHILDLHGKYGFRKLGAETTAAQKAIVKELQEQYIKPNGMYLSIAELKHSAHEGTKEERIAAILEPRYENMQVWHYRGGNTTILEDELVNRHTQHDDMMDALAAAISIAVPPVGILARDKEGNRRNVSYHPRWGGVAA